jgi:hypothetical protein
MKLFVFLSYCLFAGMFVNAQSAVDFANLTKYKDDNASILSSKKKWMLSLWGIPLQKAG